MASNQGDREAAKAKSDRTAEELGRKAARLLRRGKPRVEQALNDARPRVESAIEKAKPQAEKAAKDAWRYAQDHEDEIKRAAVKGARMRVRGPFGFLIDALQSNTRTAPPQATCPACGVQSQPNARFCTECGAQLVSAQS
jgi:zinc-ribbon domain